MVEEKDNEADIISQEEFAEAIAACCEDPQLARYFKLAPVGAKLFIGLGFYSTHFGDKADRTKYAICQAEIEPALTIKDLRYLLRFEQDAGTKFHLKMLLEERLAESEAEAEPVTSNKLKTTSAQSAEPPPKDAKPLQGAMFKRPQAALDRLDSNPHQTLSGRPQPVRPPSSARPHLTFEQMRQIVRATTVNRETTSPKYALAAVLVLGAMLGVWIYRVITPKPPIVIVRTENPTTRPASEKKEAVAPTAPPEQSNDIVQVALPEIQEDMPESHDEQPVVDEIAQDKPLENAESPVEVLPSDIPPGTKVVFTDGFKIVNHRDTKTIEVPRRYSYRIAGVPKFWIYGKDPESFAKKDNAAREKWQRLFNEAKRQTGAL